MAIAPERPESGMCFSSVLLELTLLGQFVERSGVPRGAERTRVEPAAAAGPLLLPPLPGQRGF